MRILQVHNEYQHLGGEETIVKNEYNLLKEYNHIVKQWTVSNSILKEIQGLDKVRYALKSIWSSESYQQMETHIASFQPDIIHVHNTHAILSPAIHAAAGKYNIPVVLALHNYRLLCMNSLFFRDGHVCEDCMGKTIPYPAITNRCYRDSLVQTGVLTTGTVFHRLRGTFKHVSRFIASSKFSRQKFILGGLPPEKVVVKPNFGPSDLFNPDVEKQNYGIFAGRLSTEKGLDVLLNALLKLPQVYIKIAGGGPLTEFVAEMKNKHNLTNVDLVGRLTREETVKLISQSRFLILPSVVYENFPMTIVEAFACGVPVITSNLGAMGEIVEDGQTGLLFTPNDPKSLAQKIEWAWDNLDDMEQMGTSAYQEYMEKYTGQRNHELLMDIYDQAFNSKLK